MRRPAPLRQAPPAIDRGIGHLPDGGRCTQAVFGWRRRESRRCPVCPGAAGDPVSHRHPTAGNRDCCAAPSTEARWPVRQSGGRSRRRVRQTEPTARNLFNTSQQTGRQLPRLMIKDDDLCRRSRHDLAPVCRDERQEPQPDPIYLIVSERELLVFRNKPDHSQTLPCSCAFRASTQAPKHRHCGHPLARHHRRRPSGVRACDAHRRDLGSAYSACIAGNPAWFASELAIRDSAASTARSLSRLASPPGRPHPAYGPTPTLTTSRYVTSPTTCRPTTAYRPRRRPMAV
jgi:hypothetical protein